MPPNPITEQDTVDAGNNPLEFLAFCLGSEEYGIDIQKVQELRGYDAVTHIANAPDFIKGVINLRGDIVPIVDLRIWFGLGSPVYDQFTVVIVVCIAGRIVGIVVDGVSDVIALQPAKVKRVPQMSAVMDIDSLLGVGTVDDRMLVLLDIEKLVSSPHAAGVSGVMDGVVNRLAA